MSCNHSMLLAEKNGGTLEYIGSAMGCAPDEWHAARRCGMVRHHLRVA